MVYGPQTSSWSYLLGGYPSSASQPQMSLMSPTPAAPPSQAATNQTSLLSQLGPGGGNWIRRFEEFARTNPMTINQLAAGLMAGPTLGQGLAKGFGSVPQSMQLDAKYADEAKARADLERQKANMARLIDSGDWTPKEKAMLQALPPNAQAQFLVDRMKPSLTSVDADNYIWDDNAKKWIIPPAKPAAPLTGKDRFSTVGNFIWDNQEQKFFSPPGDEKLETVNVGDGKQVLYNKKDGSWIIPPSTPGEQPKHFPATSVEGAALNILSDPNADPNSLQYKAAVSVVTQSTTRPDGSVTVTNPPPGLIREGGPTGPLTPPALPFIPRTGGGFAPPSGQSQPPAPTSTPEQAPATPPPQQAAPAPSVPTPALGPGTGRQSTTTPLPGGGSTTTYAAPPAPETPEQARVRKAAADTHNRRVGEITLRADRSIDIIEKNPGIATGARALFLRGPVGALLGSPAYKLAQEVTPIKANLAFEALAELRAASPTGGALGQVSNFEQELLMSAFGSYETFQDDETMLFNLRRLKRLFTYITDGASGNDAEHAISERIAEIGKLVDAGKIDKELASKQIDMILAAGDAPRTAITPGGLTVEIIR